MVFGISLIQARHSTGDSSIPRKPTNDEYLANNASTFELPLPPSSKRLRKTTKFLAKDNSNIEEVRSSLIIQGINKRIIRDDMISNALDAFKGDIPQAVKALYQNFQHKSIFGIEGDEACKAEEESDDTGGSIIDSGDDEAFEDDSEIYQEDTDEYEDEEASFSLEDDSNELSSSFNENTDDGEYSNNDDLVEEESEEYMGDEYEENENFGLEEEEEEEEENADDKCDELSNKVKKGTISGPVSKLLKAIMRLDQSV